MAPNEYPVVLKSLPEAFQIALDISGVDTRRAAFDIYLSFGVGTALLGLVAAQLGAKTEEHSQNNTGGQVYYYPYFSASITKADT